MVLCVIFLSWTAELTVPFALSLIRTVTSIVTTRASLYSLGKQNKTKKNSHKSNTSRFVKKIPMHCLALICLKHLKKEQIYKSGLNKWVNEL